MTDGDLRIQKRQKEKLSAYEVDLQKSILDEPV
jgi:hypothetical protein